MDNLIAGAPCFLSCDWGTSTFRLCLVNAAAMQVVSEVSGAAGIALTFRSWQQQTAQNRQSHYAAVLRQYLQLLEQQTGMPLGELPLVVSGMASASIGIHELPYAVLPLDPSGAGLVATTLQLQPFLTNPVVLISGVRSDSDVMRGEETQLLGLLSRQCLPPLIIIPGTHVKHVTLAAGRVIGFQTFMTGEFFQLLSQHSVLAASVAVCDTDTDAAQEHFFRGLTYGYRHNLLAAAFRVRTNQLLHGMPPPYNYQYLSGLLLGAELQGCLPGDARSIGLLGNMEQCRRYQAALAHLFPEVACTHFDGVAALIRGQWQVCQSVWARPG